MTRRATPTTTPSTITSTPRRSRAGLLRAMLLGVALASGALTGCGALGDCEVPLGTYSQEIVDAGGDCSDEYVRSVTGTKDIVLEKGDNEATCGSHSSQATDSSGGCESKVVFQIESDEDGLGTGTAKLTVSCAGAQLCQQNFNVYYKKR